MKKYGLDRNAPKSIFFYLYFVAQSEGIIKSPRVVVYGSLRGHFA